MDISKTLLMEQIGHSSKLPNADNHQNLDEARKKEIAKEFESVLIEKLMDNVKDSVNCIGEEKDAAAQQIDGMFWSLLGRELGQQGGFGLWKDVHQFLEDNAGQVENNQAESEQGQSIDKVG